MKQRLNLECESNPGTCAGLLIQCKQQSALWNSYSKKTQSWLSLAMHSSEAWFYSWYYTGLQYLEDTHVSVKLYNEAPLARTHEHNIPDKV